MKKNFDYDHLQIWFEPYLLENFKKNLILFSISHLLDREPNISNNSEQDENFKPQKRLRKEKKHKTTVQHRKVQKGEEHYSRNGKLIAGKTFQSQLFCKCKLKCHTKIDEEQQQSIFKTYYDFPDWSSKTLFLRSCVIREKVTKKLSDRNPIIQQKNRNYTYHY